MDIGRVLSRSLEIGWRYKFLWLLGFIMALTGGGGGGGSGGNPNFSFNNGTFRPPAPGTPQIDTALIATVGILVLCLFLLFLVLTLYFRFVARGALVSAVRTVENNGKSTLGGAWREGQNYYWRLLGLGFLINLPLVIFSLLLLLIALVPSIGTIIAFAAQATRTQPSSQDIARLVSGIIGSVILVCCAAICLTVISLAIHPIYEFAVRAIVLENTGTMDGISRGYNRVRANLGSSLMLYLVLIGARIGWSIVTAILAVPAFLVLFLVVMGLVGTNPTAAIILGVALGLPLVLIFGFIGGLFQVFESNAWTLGYMSLLAPPQVMPAPTEPTPPAPSTAAA